VAVQGLNLRPPSVIPADRVSHDARLEEIADRVLWLEDGTFRELATMATDPGCGMAVAQHDRPHLQLDGSTRWFCSAACRDEFAAAPAGSPIVPSGGRPCPRCVGPTMDLRADRDGDRRLGPSTRIRKDPMPLYGSAQAVDASRIALPEHLG
jgi:YHS domain-containing protein